MGEKPILFSAPMVRALLAGAKTQTRRVVKPQPYSVAMVPSGNHLFDYRSDLNDYSRVVPMDKAITLCPYGQPGDRLWVRETHSPQPDCWGSWDRWMRGEGGPAPVIHYKATDPTAWVDCWRPSIHMPRWASRITLEITGVRVERLQDISDADAVAEGCEAKRTADADWTAREAYRVLWESINGGGSWDANPWVWIIEFKRVAP